MAEFLLLLHDEPTRLTKLSPEEMQKAIEKYMAWTKKPFYKGGKRLTQDTGRVIKANGGKPRATDGPYSETKEVHGRLLYHRSRELRRGGGAFAHPSAPRVRRHHRGPASLGDVTTPAETGPLLDHLFRRQAGRIVAHLTRLMGPAYLELAEETVQEAMLRALQGWPAQGVPENPAAWLFRVAHNLAIDAVRRNRTLREKTDAMVAELTRSSSALLDDPAVEEQLRDDELRMIFLCCHPEIPRDSSVALSLKTVGGFSVREIARAFLADDAAIAQRLVRTKKQIRETGLTLDAPGRRGDGSSPGCGPGGDLLHLQRRLHGA